MLSIQILELFFTLEPTAPHTIPHEGATENRFGRSLAWMEDRVGVAASGTDAEEGSVRWYRHDPPTWVLDGYLKDDDGRFAVEFGASIATAGERVAVAMSGLNIDAKQAAGAVRVFERDGNLWTPVTMLSAAPPIGKGEFGAAMIYDGDGLVIGAPGNDDWCPGQFDCGAVYRYDTAFAAVSPPLDPVPSLGGKVGMGRDIVRSGDILALGASGYELPTGMAKIYTYRLDAGAWLGLEVIDPTSILVEGGCDIAVDEQEGFGSALAMDGERLLVGVAGAQAAFVLRLDVDTWICEHELRPPADDMALGFGRAVALYGRADKQVAFVGAPDAGDSQAGKLYYFRSPEPGVWEDSPGVVADDPERDGFGSSIAVSSVYTELGVDYVAIADSPDDPNGSVVLYTILASNGDACDQADECVSGVCEDAVCCDGGCPGACSHCGTGGQCEFADGQACDANDDGCVGGFCVLDGSSTGSGETTDESGDGETRGSSTLTSSDGETHVTSTLTSSDGNTSGGAPTTASGTTSDGGVGFDPDVLPDGCNCSSRGSPAGWSLSLIGLLWLRRRR